VVTKHRTAGRFKRGPPFSFSPNGFEGASVDLRIAFIANPTAWAARACLALFRSLLFSIEFAILLKP
jgi:hypothetical protein